MRGRRYGAARSSGRDSEGRLGLYIQHPILYTPYVQHKIPLPNPYPSRTQYTFLTITQTARKAPLKSYNSAQNARPPTPGAYSRSSPVMLYFETICSMILASPVREVEVLDNPRPSPISSAFSLDKRTLLRDPCVGNPPSKLTNRTHYPVSKQTKYPRQEPD